MKKFVLYLLSSLLPIAHISYSFHLYEDGLIKQSRSNESCAAYWQSTKYAIPDSYVDNIYNMWPNLTSHDMKYGETLFGFHEAVRAVWKHQNPEDCRKAKYVISSAFSGGFGAVIHVEGLACCK